MTPEPQPRTAAIGDPSDAAVAPVPSVPDALAAAVVDSAKGADPADVLAGMADSAAALVGADAVVVAVASEVPAVHGAVAGSPPPVRQVLRPVVARGDAALADELRRVAPALRTPEQLRRGPVARERADDVGSPVAALGPALSVPVVFGERLLGAVDLGRSGASAAFDAHDVEVVTSLARAVAMVLDHARLRRDAQVRERWLTATGEITRRLLGAGEEIDPTRPLQIGFDPLGMVAELARDLAGAVVAAVLEADGDQTVIRASAGPGIDHRALRGRRLDTSLSAQVIAAGQPLAVPDLEHHPARAHFPASVGFPPLGPALLLPMRTSTAEAGVLVLVWAVDDQASFAALDPSLAAGFTAQVALVLQVSAAAEDHRLVAVAEERDRIARDLHDLVIQRLFAVGMSMQSLVRQTHADARVTERLERLVDDVDETIATIRRTINSLHSMHGRDIQAEITRIVDRAAGALGNRPVLEFEGPVRTAVSDTVGVHLVAALEECLSNVVRHARATKLWVEVAVGRSVILQVRDNGRGLTGTEQAGNGLRNLRSRAEALGGSLTVLSASTGTSITWSVPIQ